MRTSGYLVTADSPWVCYTCCVFGDTAAGWYEHREKKHHAKLDVSKATNVTLLSEDGKSSLMMTNPYLQMTGAREMLEASAESSQAIEMGE